MVFVLCRRRRRRRRRCDVFVLQIEKCSVSDPCTLLRDTVIPTET